MTPRSPFSCGSTVAMTEAALVITLKVPMTFRFWMNWNGARSWGDPSRLMTRPTHPVPAQFTAIRRLAAVGRLIDRLLAVVGLGDVATDEVGVGADLGHHFLAPLLVAVEHGDPHAFGGELAGGGLARGPRRRR